METCLVKLASLALVFLAACSAGGRTQYASVYAQLEALAAQVPLACRFEQRGLAIETLCAGEDVYVMQIGTSGVQEGRLLVEQLYYQGNGYLRLHPSGISEIFPGMEETDMRAHGASENGWGKSPLWMKDYALGPAALCVKLPPADAVGRRERTDGQTVFTFSKAYLDSLHARELELAEMTLETMGDTAFAQFRKERAQRTFFHSGTLTVKMQGGRIIAATLSIEREEPVTVNGLDGSRTISPETHVVTEYYALTFPDKSEAEIRRVIEDVAATLDL